MSDKEIVWDLTEIFQGCDDPKIQKTMEGLEKIADSIVKTYKGEINKPEFTAQNLLDLVKKQEDLLSEVENLYVFSENSFSANMTLPETQKLYNSYREFTTRISTKLAFLKIELGKFISENPDLIEDSLLSNYRHFLEKMKRAYPHTLSEIEEQVVLEKDQFGVKAWSQLQSTWLNTRQIRVNVEGEERILSYGDANALFTHFDRGTRISANKSIYGLLGKDENIFSSALRNICGDWVKISRRRKYDSPMHQSLISNDTTQEIIDSLMKTMKDNVGVYRRYLRLKAKLLNLPILSCADILAPLPDVPHKKYIWDETRELMFQTYGNFDAIFEECVRDMFERAHIDAPTRVGKRNGAFCNPWYKGKSAFVLLSFTGALREVYTLAHELGHGIHSYLAARNQTFLNYEPGPSVAETGSIFAELLLTDYLINNAESTSLKKAVLAHMLDGAGRAAFQVSARVWFEQNLYKAIEKGEYLDGKTISNYWCAGRDKIYGDSVEWFDEMIWEWTMKPHYYMPNYRFYNYPYVYAQLFVYALYKNYKNEGQSFVPKFKNLLSAGGSASPKDLGKMVNLDVTKPDFWKLGINQYEDFVNELYKLVNS